MPQGDFDGVIEAYRRALDAFLKLMIELATGESDGEQRRLTIASTECQTEVGRGAAGARLCQPCICDSKWDNSR